MGLASRARLRTIGWRPNDRLDADFSCLTTVIRVPEPVGVRIESALRGIRARWPEHAYYPPASMHVTVLNLDPYVAAGEEAGEAAVIARATDVLGRHGRFRLTLRGLNVSPWTIFAQAYGADGEVSRLRASLRAAFEEQKDAPRRDSPLRRALPLVLSNAVRFTGAVDPLLLRALHRWRHHTFGPFEVHEVEIVRTDGLMSAGATNVHARAGLPREPRSGG
jgi:2'-5' RNA ligase superfamily